MVYFSIRLFDSLVEFTIHVDCVDFSVFYSVEYHFQNFQEVRMGCLKCKLLFETLFAKNYPNSYYTYNVRLC